MNPITADNIRPNGSGTVAAPKRMQTVVLAGNPNAGKTTLFNAMTGLRAKTANFPGTTVDIRYCRLERKGRLRQLIDLPGLYSLLVASPEEQVALDSLLGVIEGQAEPDAILLVLDATNLERNLFLASQVVELGTPLVVALNMYDLARRKGIRIDVAALSEELGCPVVPVAARTGEGVDELQAALDEVLNRPEGFRQPVPAGLRDRDLCHHHVRYDWAEHVGLRCITSPPTAVGRRSEAIDHLLTHPVGGVFAFIGLMLAVFYLIFSLASVPMDLIDGAFGRLGSWVTSVVPAGQVQSLLVDGVIGGVGGVLVFLPQICILFLCIALLEDSGYMARAAFVMDRLMRRVGLPGKAFVPMLSAHACAIPAIMAARVIEDRRDRFATILVLPLLTCSARLPVYAMLAALLFPQSPGMAALLFTGAYLLGITAAIGASLLLKKTILKGESRPLVIELPSYKLPCLKSALMLTWDRALIFIKKAGTVILAFSIILWWLASYPQLDPSAMRPEAQEQIGTLQVSAAAAEQAGDSAAAEALIARAESLANQEALAHSFVGRLGHLIEPALRPLGYDWKIGVGIISSFAAREMVVSALGVIYGVGETDEVGQDSALLHNMRTATRPDGTPVFGVATSVGLLVFYVLAMQCLPTLAVTRRETYAWKWAVLQLGYMSALAYGAALITFQALRSLGF